MEAANASHYDGATALAEGTLMAYNVLRGKRHKVLLAPTIHPEYRAVVRTYVQGMDIELHGAGPAQRHCMAGIRNTNYYEMALVHPRLRGVRSSIYECDYQDGLEAVDENGCVQVPEGPGLGVEYDWDFIMSHRVGGVEYK